jgi:SAM-dependent methyltransferase
VLPTARPAPVPADRYSEELLLAFTGGDYAEFVRTQGAGLRPRLVRSLALARVGPGVRVLDLGCGRGEASFHAAARGARVWALDYSPDCLALTRRSLALAPPVVRARVELVRADATALPLPDRSVDRALMLDVVEHLHPWQLALALREVRRVLKPDGWLVVHTVPNRWALAYGYPLLRLVRPSLPADPRTAYEREVHVNEQDLVGLRRLLRACGFEARVWPENLTVEQAAWRGRFDDGRALGPDDVRGGAYPLLRHPFARRLARLVMRTPLCLVAANDLYAIARPGAHERDR